MVYSSLAFFYDCFSCAVCSYLLMETTMIRFFLGFILATALWWPVMLTQQDKIEAYELLLRIPPLPQDVDVDTVEY